MYVWRGAALVCGAKTFALLLTSRGLPKSVKTGGSRGITRRSVIAVGGRKTNERSVERNCAIGNSREPPAFTVLGRTRDVRNIARF